MIVCARNHPTTSETAGRVAWETDSRLTKTNTRDLKAVWNEELAGSLKFVQSILRSCTIKPIIKPNPSKIITATAHHSYSHLLIDSYAQRRPRIHIHHDVRQSSSFQLAPMFTLLDAAHLSQLCRTRVAGQCAPPNNHRSGH